MIKMKPQQHMQSKWMKKNWTALQRMCQTISASDNDYNLER